VQPKPKTLGISVTDFELQIAQDKRNREKKELFYCPHKEVLLAECILEDENGLRYYLCLKCFKRYSILKGFKIIQQRGDETIALRKLRDRKANNLLPF